MENTKSICVADEKIKLIEILKKSQLNVDDMMIMIDGAAAPLLDEYEEIPEGVDQYASTRMVQNRVENCFPEFLLQMMKYCYAKANISEKDRAKVIETGDYLASIKTGFNSGIIHDRPCVVGEFAMTRRDYKTFLETGDSAHSIFDRSRSDSVQFNVGTGQVYGNNSYSLIYDEMGNLSSDSTIISMNKNGKIKSRGYTLLLTITVPQRPSFDLKQYLSSVSLRKIEKADIDDIMNSFCRFPVPTRSPKDSDKVYKALVKNTQAKEDNMRKELYEALYKLMHAYNEVLKYRKVELSKFQITNGKVSLSRNKGGGVRWSEATIETLKTAATNPGVIGSFHSDRHKALMGNLMEATAPFYGSLRVAMGRINELTWRSVWQGTREGSPETGVVTRFSSPDKEFRRNLPGFVGTLSKQLNMATALGMWDDKIMTNNKGEDLYAKGEENSKYFMGCGKDNLTLLDKIPDTVYMDLGVKKSDGLIQKGHSFLGTHNLSNSRTCSDVFVDDSGNGLSKYFHSLVDKLPTINPLADSVDGEWSKEDSKKPLKREDILSPAQKQLSEVFTYVRRNAAAIGGKMFIHGLLDQVDNFCDVCEDYDTVFGPGEEGHNGEFSVLLLRKDVNLDGSFSNETVRDMWKYIAKHRLSKEEYRKSLIQFIRGRDFVVKSGDMRRVDHIATCNPMYAWREYRKDHVMNIALCKDGESLYKAFPYFSVDPTRSMTMLNRMINVGDDDFKMADGEQVDDEYDDCDESDSDDEEMQDELAARVADIDREDDF